MKNPPRRRPCPHDDCPSHEPGARSHVIRHSVYKTRRGPRRRLLCKVCRRTFVATRGTAYYRLRSSRQTFDRVVSFLVEGSPQASIARALRMCPSTVSRWSERAGRHAQRFGEIHTRILNSVEIQVDEVRTYGTGAGERTWVYNAIEVWSRMWAAMHVGRRTLRTTLLFSRSLAKACPPNGLASLVTSDDFKYYVPTLRRSLGPTCVHVQVKNRYARGRILQTRSRLVTGSPLRLEFAQGRSEDSKRPNTSYVERLGLLMRRSCSYLHRRTPSPMRKPQRLTDVLDVIRCNYNFIRPHSSLKFGKVKRTPAMQAGIFDRALSFREIFSMVLPPRREPVLDFRNPRGAVVQTS